MDGFKLGVTDGTCDNILVGSSEGNREGDEDIFGFDCRDGVCEILPLGSDGERDVCNVELM